MAKRKLMEADLAARERMITNAEHLRQLAEKAQAQLDRRKQSEA